MGTYALENGTIVDTRTAVKMWRGEYRDTCLYLMPDGRYVLFIWEEDTAAEVASLEAAMELSGDMF